MTTVKTQKKKRAIQPLWALHWLMVACFLVLFVVGIYMADLPRDAPYRTLLYNFHKSMGVLVLILLAIRIFLLLRVLVQKTKSRRPKRLSTRIQTVAIHTVLYFFMLVVPFSGYALSNTAGNEVVFFGLGLPPLFTKNLARLEWARGLHFWLAYAFLVLIGFHILVQRKFVRMAGYRAFKAVTRTSPSGSRRK